MSINVDATTNIGNWSASGTPRATTPEDALARITAPDRPLGESLTRWSALSSSDQLRLVRGVPEPGVDIARVEVRGGRIFVRPEHDSRSDLPSVQLPNNVGARGFAPGFTTHDYLVPVIAPPALRGHAGLKAIERALIANPTPGRDAPSTPTGARNDVGGLVWFDGGDNFVRSYAIPSTDPNRSAAVVNYTIKGEHAMGEGFVLRFAELRPDGRIELVTYGEGNAVKQAEALSAIWEPIVTRVWTENAAEVFNMARHQ